MSINEESKKQIEEAIETQLKNEKLQEILEYLEEFRNKNGFYYLDLLDFFNKKFGKVNAENYAKLNEYRQIVYNLTSFTFDAGLSICMFDDNYSFRKDIENLREAIQYSCKKGLEGKDDEESQKCVKAISKANEIMKKLKQIEDEKEC